jgi:hypothetical protein
MSSYRLRNWPKYERALEARGSLTLWLTPETVTHWRAMAPPSRSARRGHRRVYSDEAITCLLTLRELYRLGLRETVGLTRSLFALLHLALPVPDHTTLSRRRARLRVPLPVRAVSAAEAPLHLVVDSTGLALVGEGSWQRHRCRGGARPAWTRHYLRVHLGVDEATGELRALGVSGMAVTDGEMLPRLLAAERSPLRQVTGDGAYDEWRCYEAVAARPERPRAVFPPPRPRRGPKRARIKQHGNRRRAPLDRDQHIRRIRRVGRRRWKEEVGYHRRSLSETAVSRFKRTFGERLTARTFAGQCAEVFLRGALLNRLLWLGRPESYCRA